MFHPVDLCGIQKALHVFTQAKDGWPSLGRITAYSFKNTGTIVKDMRHDVDTRVVPIDELAIVPNDVRDSRGAHVFRLTIFNKHRFTPFETSEAAGRIARLPERKSAFCHVNLANPDCTGQGTIA
jgi:hypothetical protein